MEEVNVVPSTSAGIDYGWDLWEGILPHEGVPDPTGVTFPLVTYLHGPHCSVTGGHVLRGPNAGDLAGRYVFGDFCSGFLWAASEIEGVGTSELLAQTGFPISSFGEDEAGNVYVVDYNGRALRLDP